MPNNPVPAFVIKKNSRTTRTWTHSFQSKMEGVPDPTVSSVIITAVDQNDQDATSDVVDGSGTASENSVQFTVKAGIDQKKYIIRLACTMQNGDIEVVEGHMCIDDLNF